MNQALKFLGPARGRLFERMLTMDCLQDVEPRLLPADNCFFLAKRDSTVMMKHMCWNIANFARCLR